jgi:hypothetical protein
MNIKELVDRLSKLNPEADVRLMIDTVAMDDIPRGLVVCSEPVAKVIFDEWHQLVTILGQSDPPPDNGGAFSRESTPEETEANAKLSAAAPELLEACNLLLRDYYGDEETEQKARAAIAKAPS